MRWPRQYCKSQCDHVKHIYVKNNSTLLSFNYIYGCFQISNVFGHKITVFSFTNLMYIYKICKVGDSAFVTKCI